MHKRPLKLLIFVLAVLMAVLATSVGLMLLLEGTPGIRRDPRSTRPNADADYENRFHQALDFFNQGKFPEADALVQTLISERPGASEAWQLQGSIAFRRGFYEDAERSFRQLLRLQPYNAAGYNNLSQALLRLDRKTDALDAVERAVEFAPDNSAILLNAASQAAVLEQKEKAVDFLKRAVRAGVTPEAISRERALVELLEQPEILEALKAAEPQSEAQTAPDQSTEKGE